MSTSKRAWLYRPVAVGCILAFMAIGAWGQDASIDKEVAKMAATIDASILAHLSARQRPAPAEATDSEFLRRAYLDLTGINPDAALTVGYLKSSDPNKRTRMLEELVQSSGFAVRFADYWTDLLLPESNDLRPAQERESLRRWLLDRFADNVRYDRIVADLLVSAGDPSEQPTGFFTALEVKPEKLAEKTSRIFLGVALDCAQCHDHPFDKWKQADFWGVAAYFAQVQAPNRPNANAMMSAGVIDVDQGEVTLPETQTVIAPKPLLDDVQSANAFGSRRQQLAIWVTSRQNPWFAKAAVNRIWAMLMGRGLVEPVDDIGTKSIAAYPGLLEELAVFFRQSKFDVRKLALAIAMSKAYASSTREFREDPEATPFAAMRAKPLTARQLSATLRQAARQSSASDADLWSQVASKLGAIRGESSEFTGGVLQSLLLQNSSETESLWSESSSRLLKAIHAPHLKAEEQLDWIYLATLSRYPTDEEREKLNQWFRNLPDDDARKAAQADLLWAIINSSEFGMTP